MWFSFCCSSVWGLSVGTPLIKFPDSGNPASRQGEAIVVDLGKRGVVFALLSDQSWENGLYQAFPTEAPSSKRGIEYYKNNLKVGMTGEWKDALPKMVMFKDITDPKSVAFVYVNELYAEGTHIYEDHFEEIFGVGVTLKQITVEITDEPLTLGIEKILLWLNQVNGGYLDGQFSNNSNELSNTLHGGNFRTGAKR